MSCNCFGTLQEAQLVRDCYPPSKVILTSGPDFKPLSSDLSKLTYRCTNQSSRLAKVGEELEKRVVKEAGRSSGGYAKSRASLLISLAILRTLITECHRDLHLFSRSIIRIINVSLDVKVYQKGGPDLEVIGRAASCFTAYTSYTDGGRGLEDSTLRTYLSVLQKFAAFATVVIPANTASTNGSGEKSDLEQQHRTRLIGLAALNGAASSHALFSSSLSDFPQQVGIIIPALCTNIFEGSMSALQTESARIEVDTSPSPFFSEFSTRRPARTERAPSLSAHVPGEQGPSDTDVLSAALRSLAALIRNCQVAQATHVLDAICSYLDTIQWQDVERSCWLAERLAALMSLQYRFVIPTRLVEILAEMPDGPLNVKHTTLVAMITAILSSPTSLVGLAVVDLTNNFISLIARRIRIDPKDALLPALVQCTSSLGTHIYYADQINDIVEEVAVRMSELDPADKARPEILRVLIHCIMGLMLTAIRADAMETKATAHPETPSTDALASPEKEPKAKGKAPASAELHPRTGRRNLISPQVWQETLPLLCESTYAVRSAYSRALIMFLKNELPREQKPVPGEVNGDAIKTRPGRPEEMVVKRFCNALNAALYTLAMSSCLGTGAPNDDSPSASPMDNTAEAKDSPEQSVAPGTEGETKAVAEPATSSLPAPIAVPRTETKSDKGVSFNLQEPTPSSTPQGSSSPGRGTPTKSSIKEGRSTPPHKPSGGTTPPRKRLNRRVSLPLNRLNSMLVIESFDNVATPFDFTSISQILTALHDAVPSAALLTSVPMLLALDRDASSELVRRPGDGRQGAWVLERKRSIREVVGFMWRSIGRRWGVEPITTYADKTLNSLPEPFEVPNPAAPPPGILPLPDQPFQFTQHTGEGESSSSTQPFLDPGTLISELSASSAILESTNQDVSSLTRRFTTKWTVESALKDSVERFSAVANLSADPHYDVASVLMSLNNNSYQSFGQRQPSRPVDVMDLREALGGRTRNDSLHGSSPPSIISTAGRSVDETTPKKRGQNTDVQEVLKDIFKSGKRRGGNMKRGIQAKVDGLDLVKSISPLSGGGAGSGAGASAKASDQVNGESIEMSDVKPKTNGTEVAVPRHPEGPASLLAPKTGA